MAQPKSSSKSAAASAASERRRSTRAELARSFISVDLGDDNGGLLLNLSEAGAMVQAVAQMRVGTRTAFVFASSPAKSRVEGEAVVAWVGPSGLVAGLRFERISPASRAELKRWLETADQRQENGRLPAAAAPPPSTNSASTPQASTGKVSLAASELVANLLRDVRLITGADGASLALRDSAGCFTCAYSEGMAPEVGSTVRTDQGLSAECITTGRIMVCEDASKDERVNPAVRRQLGSAVLVPVLSGTTEKAVIALWGVFSRRANAFTVSHVKQLRAIAATLRVVPRTENTAG